MIDNTYAVVQMAKFCGLAVQFMFNNLESDK